MDDAIDPILSCTLASRIHSCEYDPLVRNITDSTLPENKTGRLGLGTHTERRSNLIKRQTLARDSRPPHVPRLRLLAVGLDAAFVARGGRRRRGSVGARTVEGDVEIRWRELCASGECHQTSGARRDATVRDARGVGEGAMMRGWDDGERREVFKGFDARGGRVDARRGWMRE